MIQALLLRILRTGIVTRFVVRLVLINALKNGYLLIGSCTSHQITLLFPEPNYKTIKIQLMKKDTRFKIGITIGLLLAIAGGVYAQIVNS
jgi:hypothetical protein